MRQTALAEISQQDRATRRRMSLLKLMCRVVVKSTWVLGSSNHSLRMSSSLLIILRRSFPRVLFCTRSWVRWTNPLKILWWNLFYLFIALKVSFMTLRGPSTRRHRSGGPRSSCHVYRVPSLIKSSFSARKDSTHKWFRERVFHKGNLDSRMKRFIAFEHNISSWN